MSADRCAGTGPTGADRDWPGGHDKQRDVPPWVEKDFDGPLHVGDKVLTFGGDGGKTIGTSMNNFVLNNCVRDGNGNCLLEGGRPFAWAMIVVWDNAEVWKSKAYELAQPPNDPKGPIDRVRVNCFLCVQINLLDNPNQTRAFYDSNVRCVVGSGGGPPRATANAVRLIE